MKKIYFLTIPLLLHAISPFESSKPKSFDLSCFETKATSTTKQAARNPKIRCRYVCDKKIYKEQKIADAISYYKMSEDYKFRIK